MFPPSARSAIVLRLWSCVKGASRRFAIGLRPTLDTTPQTLGALWIGTKGKNGLRPSRQVSPSASKRCASPSASGGSQVLARCWGGSMPRLRRRGAERLAFRRWVGGGSPLPSPLLLPSPSPRHRHRCRRRRRCPHRCHHHCWRRCHRCRRRRHCRRRCHCRRRRRCCRRRRRRCRRVVAAAATSTTAATTSTFGTSGTSGLGRCRLVFGVGRWFASWVSSQPTFSPWARSSGGCWVGGRVGRTLCGLGVVGCCPGLCPLIFRLSSLPGRRCCRLLRSASLMRPPL